MIICRRCGFKAESPKNFSPCISVYNDIRCPECGSTDNEHNSEYQEGLLKKMGDHLGDHKHCEARLAEQIRDKHRILSEYNDVREELRARIIELEKSLEQKDATISEFQRRNENQRNNIKVYQKRYEEMVGVANKHRDTADKLKQQYAAPWTEGVPNKTGMYRIEFPNGEITTSNVFDTEVFAENNPNVVSHCRIPDNPPRKKLVADCCEFGRTYLKHNVTENRWDLVDKKSPRTLSWDNESKNCLCGASLPKEGG